MNRIAFTFRSLTLAGAAVLFALGCSTPANSSGTTNNGTQDVATLDGSGGSDTGVGTTDSSGATDAVATDTGTGTDATQTADVGDTTGDTTLLPDVGDAKGDGTGDVKTDVKTDTKDTADTTKTPTKCLTKADCKSAGFGDCLAVDCNVATGKCELNPATDGKTCAVKGPCGGSGVCKQGACNFTGTCVSQTCAAQPVKCGDKLTLSVGSFGPSVLGKYNCSATTWDGGEKVLSLAGDATQAVVATVTLSDDASPSATLLDIGGSGGVCNPATCDAIGTKLTLGVPVGVSRTLVVDTLKADGGSVTVTIECKPVVTCGDNVCATGQESPETCPKDCGKSNACGDGKCDAKTENCNSCPADCGACPPACPSKKDPGCPGNPCEECVCAQDDFCCTDSWDSSCVSECSSCGGSACGDNQCDGAEDSSSCPNDCPTFSFCGDGICSPATADDPTGESCTDCPKDCGTCSGPAATCGDGKCNTNEQCATCPQDCGACSKSCGEPAGCGGCGCEATVCAEDPYCCSTKWDSTCVSECKATGKDGPTCPVDKCGDGVCSGSESCNSCELDCGACPAVCDNGKCEAGEDKVNCAKDCGCGNGECDPDETLTTCKEDCSLGCEGKCDSESPSKDAKGGTCWCDSFCTENGDCCADKVQFCGK